MFVTDEAVPGAKPYWAAIDVPGEVEGAPNKKSVQKVFSFGAGLFVLLDVVFCCW
jgi:hypothetical protein